MGKKLMKLLEECSIRKGGHNILPTRPRPKTPPPGQGGGVSKYLLFKKLEQGIKTDIIEVASRPRNLRDGSVREGRDMSTRLGVIKWFGRWRQYAFFPEVGTVFNTECLEDIRIFIKGMMKERRKD